MREAYIRTRKQYHKNKTISGWLSWRGFVGIDVATGLAHLISDFEVAQSVCFRHTGLGFDECSFEVGVGDGDAWNLEVLKDRWLDARLDKPWELLCLQTSATRLSRHTGTPLGQGTQGRLRWFITTIIVTNLNPSARLSRAISPRSTSSPRGVLRALVRRIYWYQISICCPNPFSGRR